MGFFEVLGKVKGNIENGLGSNCISVRKGKVRGQITWGSWRAFELQVPEVQKLVNQRLAGKMKNEERNRKVVILSIREYEKKEKMGKG